MKYYLISILILFSLGCKDKPIATDAQVSVSKLNLPEPPEGYVMAEVHGRDTVTYSYDSHKHIMGILLWRNRNWYENDGTGPIHTAKKEQVFEGQRYTYAEDTFRDKKGAIVAIIGGMRRDDESGLVTYIVDSTGRVVGKKNVDPKDICCCDCAKFDGIQYTESANKKQRSDSITLYGPGQTRRMATPLNDSGQVLYIGKPIPWTVHKHAHTVNHVMDIDTVNDIIIGSVGDVQVDLPYTNIKPQKPVDFSGIYKHKYKINRIQEKHTGESCYGIDSFETDTLKLMQNMKNLRLDTDESVNDNMPIRRDSDFILIGDAGNPFTDSCFNCNLTFDSLGRLVPYSHKPTQKKQKP